MATFGDTGVDPWQSFLQDFILQKSQSPQAQVPGYTQGALKSFTQNPAVAAEYFPELAAPLLGALKPAESAEVTQLNDMFRKAGGTGGGAIQSGAYAQAGRQLISDQAQRRQQLLASQYVPLTSQLSKNLTSAIALGEQLPESTLAMIRNLVPLAAKTGQQVAPPDPWANIPPSVGIGSPSPESQLVNVGSWNQHYA